MLAGDVRYVFGRMPSSRKSASWTKDALRFGTTDMKVAPIWKAELDHTGRSWGFNYRSTGISDEFVSRSGFAEKQDHSGECLQPTFRITENRVRRSKA